MTNSLLFAATGLIVVSGLALSTRTGEKRKPEVEPTHVKETETKKQKVSGSKGGGSKGGGSKGGGGTRNKGGSKDDVQPPTVVSTSSGKQFDIETVSEEVWFAIRLDLAWDTLGTLDRLRMVGELDTHMVNALSQNRLAEVESVFSAARTAEVAQFLKDTNITHTINIDAAATAIQRAYRNHVHRRLESGQSDSANTVVHMPQFAEEKEAARKITGTK